MKLITDAQYRGAAARRHPGPAIEIDATGIVHRVEQRKPGVYVQAWIFVFDDQVTHGDHFDESDGSTILTRLKAPAPEPRYIMELGAPTGDVKVAWLNLGEGVDGDYNAADPQDQNLLRFDVYKKIDNDWEEWDLVENGSLCTDMPASAPNKVLQKALAHILLHVEEKVRAGQSIKGVVDQLSCIGLSNYAPRIEG